MKVVIVNKKNLINKLFYIGVLIISTIIIYFIYNSSASKEAISPVNLIQEIKTDLNGDGKKEILQQINSQNKIDFSITSSNDNVYLSTLIDDKTLFTNNIHWQPKAFINDISRDTIPELIIQGSKDNKPISYVFHWDKKNYSLVYSSNNNILGILDSKNSKTPQCFSISSSEGTASLNSFMLINDTILDTSKENSKIPSFDSVTKFIDIVQLPYIFDELPDIFTTSIDKGNLSLLWSLDKDNYNYTFQNGFFYDYKWNEDYAPSNLRWRLSFEKSSYRGNQSDKSEFTILIDLEKINDSYKINSIQKIK
ncbi:hypothetical protein [Clostridium sp. C2-6-12]|uniref:hypothetical protein n=1 Tax=Clostridium sp. C2-6-12 TaxID=2698832 RepID=UPI001370700E|nr:hypothetical protein [Clostridium sp. C2-6-12]